MIANILNRSSKIYDKKTFIKSHDKRLSYEEAYALTKQHQSWIEQLITEQYQNQTCHHDHHGYHGHHGHHSKSTEIVIAYLSFNSPDLLLSMIGSIGLGGTIQSSGCHRSTSSVRIAMLNARWSAKEIAQALAIKSNHGDLEYRNINTNSNTNTNTNSRVENMTIIIYGGQAMSIIAKEACDIMNSNLQQRQNHHISMTFALPTLTSTLSPMIIPTLVGNKNNNKKNYNDNNINHQASNNFHNDDDDDDEAIILFTSGTTSGPKGVKLSHLSMFLQSMTKISKPSSYDEHTNMLATTVPFFHVGGLSSALAVMLAGGCLVFPTQTGGGSFDPNVALDSIRIHDHDHKCYTSNTVEQLYDEYDNDHSVNTLVIVPAMLHAILNEVERRNSSTTMKQETRNDNNIYNNVRLLLIGGQSLTGPQLVQSKKVFPNARIVQTYACTEAASSMTYATVCDPTTSTNTNTQRRDYTQPRKDGDGDDNKKDMNTRVLQGMYAGMAPPHIQLGIFALKDNKPTLQKAPPYTIGAIGTKGPHVMNGYWRRGSQNDGIGIGIVKQWLITNDLGYIDNKGGLYFCGRLNDVIRTGGETVFAPEVESTIIRHPDVDQCAVFALPDERFGECVCAAIILKDRQNIQNDTLRRMKSEIDSENKEFFERIRNFCVKQNLSGFKRPKRVFILDELPRNSSGKVLKHELKHMFRYRESKL